MPINAIVMMDRKSAIGKKGDQPYKLKEDLKSFKHYTKGCVCVGGRKTLEAIGFKLPGRHVVGLTRDASLMENPERGFADSYYTDPESLIFEVRRLAFDQEVYIIGGGELYQMFLPYFDTLRITVLEETMMRGADTWFLEPKGKTDGYRKALESQGFMLSTSAEIVDTDQDNKQHRTKTLYFVKDPNA